MKKKKSGEIRFRLDLRKLNDIVKLDEFQLPKIPEILSNLGNNKVFSVIDLKDEFFQVELKKEDRYKTAFIDCKHRLM